MSSKVRRILSAILLLAVGALLALTSLSLFIPKEVTVESPVTELIGELIEEVQPEIHYPSFVEVTEGCDSNHMGGCVNLRSAPTSTAPLVLKLRMGMVLPIATTTVTDETGREWYKVHFTEWIRYPERISDEWYVAAEYVKPFISKGAEEFVPGVTPATNKRIIVDRSEQMLRAYEGTTLFMESPVSTGLDLTPTPRGQFTIYRKTPSRYMQGPLPGISDQYYDLPGVPWNLYFTNEGGAIHGAYWHQNFGQQWSHGCVNVPLGTAQQLYEWADLGTKVVVQD